MNSPPGMNTISPFGWALGTPARLTLRATLIPASVESNGDTRSGAIGDLREDFWPRIEQPIVLVSGPYLKLTSVERNNVVGAGQSVSLTHLWIPGDPAHERRRYCLAMISESVAFLQGLLDAASLIYDGHIEPMYGRIKLRADSSQRGVDCPPSTA